MRKVRIDHVIADYWEAMFFDGSMIFLDHRVSAASIIPALSKLQVAVGIYRSWPLELGGHDGDQHLDVPSREEAERISRKHVDIPKPLPLDDLVIKAKVCGVEVTDKAREAMVRGDRRSLALRRVENRIFEAFKIL